MPSSMLAGCASSTAATPTAAASAAADASAEATADAARFTAENFIKEFDAADVSHISILAKKCDVGDDGKMAFTGKTGITKADEEAKSNWAELLNRMGLEVAAGELVSVILGWFLIQALAKTNLFKE